MKQPPPVNDATVAREIAPDVYCLGPRGRTQTDVYLVRSGSSWFLVDAGWAKDGPSIKRAAELLFGADARPAAILLTHSHPDHAGSALELARTWACPVYVHPAELPSAMGDFAALSTAGGPLDRWLILPLMRFMGRRRRDAMLARSSLRDVARAFDPITGVPGLPDWECVPTPGHTPGHVSFFRPRDRVLISGDALVTVKLNSLLDLLLMRQGLSGPPWYTTMSWATAKASVATLAGLEPQVLAGGHGRPMTGPETATAVRAFARRFSGRDTTRSTAAVLPVRQPSRGRLAVNPRVGWVVLGLSGVGFPLSQLAIRRLGARGALVVEAACAGLLARDTALLAMGAPSRLRRGPAALLWLETVAGAAAVLAGVRPVVSAEARERARGAHRDRHEAIRRAAIGALFGLHTLRYRIYLRPDHGLRYAD